MDKKLHVLNRVGEHYENGVRFISLYDAATETLTQFGLCTGFYDGKKYVGCGYSLAVFLNVNTGNVVLKSCPLAHTNIHSEKIELKIDNETLSPNPVSYGSKTQGYYDESDERFYEPEYIHIGYEYRLTEEEFLKIARSKTLSVKIQFAYLKE